MQAVAEATWNAAWEEFGHAELGDSRRRDRLVNMMARVLERPGGTIQAVFDNRAELHGAYDFVENDHVDPDAMLDAAARAAARRAHGLPFVWIVSDGTSQRVTDRTRTKGTGRLGSSPSTARGDQIHDALVLDPDGVPLGIVALEAWQRGPKKTRSLRAKRATDQKETQHWLTVRESTRALFEEVCPQLVRHYLHDRGADAWPVVLDMAQARANEYTTIRAAWDRRLWNDEDTDAPTQHLREALAQAPVVGTYQLSVPAGPDRTAREATLAVRACVVTLDLKDKRTSRHHRAEVWAVCAREQSRVPPKEKPLEWMLLTTYPIHTLVDAKFVLSGYAQRWVIEQFHQAWKSAGTELEVSQLAAPDHRARWRIILAVVAATLLRWQRRALQHPTTPAEEEFTAEELEAVRDMQEDDVVPEQGPVTLWQVVAALAHLGGWAGSKTRAPGITVLTRGWREVMAYLKGKRRAARRAKRLQSGSS